MCEPRVPTRLGSGENLFWQQMLPPLCPPSQGQGGGVRALTTLTGPHPLDSIIPQSPTSTYNLGVRVQRMNWGARIQSGALPHSGWC